MQYFYDRLVSERKKNKLTQDHVAKELKISKRAYCNYEAGVSAPDVTQMGILALIGFDVYYITTGIHIDSLKNSSIEKVAEIYNNEVTYPDAIQVNRLVAMEESPNLHHEIVKIQRYSVNAGAGRGVVNYEEQIVEYIELSREFIHDQLNLRHDKIVIISVKGASMEPTLNHGDQIFVDLTRKQINTNDVYVILVDDELLIKRVQMKVNGTVWLISDNKKFEPEQLTKEELAKLNVVGRVLPCKFGKFNL